MNLAEQKNAEKTFTIVEKPSCHTRGFGIVVKAMIENLGQAVKFDTTGTKAELDVIRKGIRTNLSSNGKLKEYTFHSKIIDGNLLVWLEVKELS